MVVKVELEVVVVKLALEVVDVKVTLDVVVVKVALEVVVEEVVVVEVVVKGIPPAATEVVVDRASTNNTKESNNTMTARPAELPPFRGLIPVIKKFPPLL